LPRELDHRIQASVPTGVDELLKLRIPASLFLDLRLDGRDLPLVSLRPATRRVTTPLENNSGTTPQKLVAGVVENGGDEG
jgi:hypothetical protein